ncbi:MAG: Peptidase M23 [Candidatus Peregrinibacteria bacterium GW2011_GWA2_47_7]|nr:MAG: Peptidase M23 [Candidatus Peregrinibacteria bacterium GW2011_GWA2_47_7]
MSQNKKNRFKRTFFGIVVVIMLLIIPSISSASLNEAELTTINSETLFLYQLENSIEEAKDQSAQLRQNISHLKEKLKENDEKIEEVKIKLTEINVAMLATNRKLLAVKKQIAENKNALLVLEREKQDKEEERRELQSALQNDLETLYDHYQLAINKKQKLETSRILLASIAVDDFIKEQNQLEVLTILDMRIAERLEIVATGIAESEKAIQHKQEKLALLEKKVASEQRNLDAHKKAKEKLLKQVHGKQYLYEDLLAEMRREQVDIEGHVERLKENHSFIDEKLAQLKEEGAITGDTNLQALKDRLTRKPLTWPVLPKLGISAYFRDEAYKATLGIPHNAIDIPVIQGSSVKAAATGVVYKTFENGNAYSYIIIAHRNGLLTLYGHVSEILVEEGETVGTGQVIGKSGGLPGTKGAGWLTTGAHLHLEVFKDWKHTDPLQYLPLEYLPLEYVPEKYLNDSVAEQDGKKVLRPELRRRAVTPPCYESACRP